MAGSSKTNSQANARRVRVPSFPTYREVRGLLAVWPGRSKSDVTQLRTTILALTGEPGNPADWSDPDAWIPEKLSGDQRELADAIWTGSGKVANPRHTAGSWTLVRHYALIEEDSDGTLQLTDRGRDFLDHQLGEMEALVDTQEGLMGLLGIVSDTGPARSGVLKDPWDGFLRECGSSFRSETTIRDTLHRRLSNLRDRDLLAKSGVDYSITEVGRDYLKRVGPPREARMKTTTLDGYLATAWNRRDGIYSAEAYKEENLAKALKRAREALLRDDDDWPSLVTAAIKHRDNNIIYWGNQGKLTDWIDANRSEAREALLGLWSEGDRSPGDRVRSFDMKVPTSVWSQNALGTRLNSASYLMMGLDAQHYPPYQRTPFTKAYGRLGYPSPTANEPGGVYEHVLGFLDRLVEEARKRRMEKPGTRLEAQSVVWQLRDDPVVSNGEPPPEVGFTELVKSLDDAGLLFSQELVANYLLALQTKRFAILTGISGTGKTKIARAVAKHFQPTVTRKVFRKIPDDAVEIKVGVSHLKHSVLTIPQVIVRRLSLLGPDAPRADRQIRIRYPGGETELTYQHRDSTEIFFRGEFKTWYHSNLELGDRIWLRVLEGETPEADRLEIDVPATEFEAQHLDNYVVVPVRPDWVDNRGLLGYLNPLTNEYSTTPFLNLLLSAREEEDRAKEAGEKPHPFFVILDEMNLARVEHYFSDFLSALESGEPIPLHEDEAIEGGESESGPQVPRELKVPGNVLFTGTVNVDETTYMFSPKVLDRAFTIEFDQVDLGAFATGRSSDDYAGLTFDGAEGALDLLRSGSSDDDWKPGRDDWKKFSEETGEHQRALVRLHRILERQHRHFGYRVANEIARFVNLAREQAGDSNGAADAAVDAAFDLALLQKVLPKFHGTQQELESLLQEIFLFAVHGGGHIPKKDRTVELDGWKVVKGRLVSRRGARSPSGGGNRDAAGNETDSDDTDAAVASTETPVYPRTGAKVLRMLHRLRDRGFTSFIE